MAHSNPITIGMLAHVDAGKTTLSEAILYSAGSIRKLGRVDNQDTFLDTGDMERPIRKLLCCKETRPQ